MEPHLFINGYYSSLGKQMDDELKLPKLPDDLPPSPLPTPQEYWHLVQWALKNVPWFQQEGKEDKPFSYTTAFRLK